MKKIFFLLTMSFVSNFCLSQYDFYKWQHEARNREPVSTKCGITTTSDNITYYIGPDFDLMQNKPDGLNYISSLVCDNAPKAKQGTNIIVNDNRIIYKNSYGHVTIITLDNQECSVVVLDRKYANINPKIALSETGNLYFVNDYDHKLWVYVPDGHNSYNCWSLNSHEVADWSDIKADNNKVFYVNKSNNVCYMSYDYGAGVWNSYELTNCKVKTESHIEVNYENIYFINENDECLWNYWKQGPNQYGYAPLNAQVIQPLTYSEIIYEDSHLYYIGTNNKLNTLFYDDCSWYHKVLRNVAVYTADYGALSIKSMRLNYVSEETLHIIYPPENIINRFYVKGNDLMFTNNDGIIETWSGHIVNMGFHFNYDPINNKYWIGPNNLYQKSDEWINSFLCDDEDACNQMIEDNFEDIFDMGFRAIRIFGLGVTGLPEVTSPNSNQLHVWRWNPNLSPRQQQVLLNTEITAPRYYQLVNKLIETAGAKGLKVIFLTGGKYANMKNRNDLSENYSSFLTDFATNITHLSTILAVDIMNEPCRPPNSLEVKEDICDIVRKWNSALKENESNILSTIGLEYPKHTLYWDPGIMDVDFISFHFYSQTGPYYELGFNGFDKSKVDIYRYIKWVYNNRLEINKPWIIGEVGFSGINVQYNPGLNSPDGSWTQQADYADLIIPASYYCNSKAFSWWQYHEWDRTDPNSDWSSHLGLVDINDNYKTIISSEREVFNNNGTQNDGCGCNLGLTDAEYYNIDNSANMNSITGTITDPFGNAIRDAVIVAFTMNYENSYYTFSNLAGEYVINYPPDETIHVIRASGINRSFYEDYSVYSKMDIKLDDFECSCDDDRTKVSNLESIETDKKNFNNISKQYFVYPNPANDIITIKSYGESDNGNFTLINSYGYIINEGKLEPNHTIINISSLCNGLYFILINTANTNESHKFIKQ